MLYQPGTYGPHKKRTHVADHSTRKRALQSSLTDMLHFNAYGKRPTVKSYIGSVKKEWFDIESAFFNSCHMDEAWAVARLLPLKVFECDIQKSNAKDQRVPGWGGFYATVFPNTSLKTAIGYCPMFKASPTEFNTVFTVMNTVQKMVQSLQQDETVITFDMAIYVKAKEIQMWQPRQFENTVIRLGGFHIALNYLATLGKMFADSGLEDLLIESGVYGSGAASAIQQGKTYNRGVRGCTLAFECFFLLKWRAFMRWPSKMTSKSPTKMT